MGNRYDFVRRMKRRNKLKLQKQLASETVPNLSDTKWRSFECLHKEFRFVEEYGRSKVTNHRFAMQGRRDIQHFADFFIKG